MGLRASRSQTAMEAAAASPEDGPVRDIPALLVMETPHSGMIEQVRGKISEAMDALHGNIAQLLLRGNALDSTLDRTEQLSVQSERFYRAARRKNRWWWWCCCYCC